VIYQCYILHGVTIGDNVTIGLGLIIIIPTIVPFCIIMVAGNLKYNEKVKKIVMLILSMVYNGIVGFISPIFCVCTFFLMGGLTKFGLVILIFIYIIILLPLNIFMKRKGKVNIFLYVIINIAIFILGIYIYLFCQYKR